MSERSVPTGEGRVESLRVARIRRPGLAGGRCRTSAHYAALAASELPQCLTWLWRGYDPAKTEQTFEQSEEEKAKPPFRVRIYNR